MGATVGVCRCKDEVDIIAFTVKHMLTQVDRVIVEDNGSTDGTLQALSDLDVDVLHDATVGYYQSAAMSRLAEIAARRHDAAIVVPFDADEAWYSPFGRVADVLAEHPGAIFTAELYDHVATARDRDDANPLARIGWRRREPACLPKVAVRPRPSVTIHQGNHGADFGATIGGLLVVRHFPYRSAEQFVSKVRNGSAAYAATDLPEDAGKHWRDYGRLLDAGGPAAVGDVFRAWFWSPAPELDATLTFDPAPVACRSAS
ncbi:MAG: glycosyltransferase family 2 protein [Actinomycetota bacterium]